MHQIQMITLEDNNDSIGVKGFGNRYGELGSGQTG